MKLPIRRRDLIRLIALTPLAGSLRKLAPAVGPEANAVDAYRAGIAALPAWSEGDKALLAEAAVAPPDVRAALLVRRGGRALDAMARGAAAGNCEWGDAWVGDGFNATFGEIVGYRSLARLAALRARLAFDAGLHARGVDDVVTSMALARHLGRGAVMIAQLVGFANEHVAIDVAAGPLPRLDHATLRVLADRLRRLPLPVGRADTVRAERAFGVHQAATDKPDDITYEHRGRFIALCDRMAAILDAGGDPSVVRTEPGGGEFWPPFEAYLRARELVEVRRALLLAAIEVAIDGPAAVGRVPDPAGGRPFALALRDGGFVLSSRYRPEVPFPPPVRTKPELIVGHP